MSGRFHVFPRHMSLRARLTLTYGAMFLIAGVVLLGATYALFNQELDRSDPALSFSLDIGDQTPDGNVDVRDDEIATDEGSVLSGARAENWLEGQEELIRNSATTSLLTQGSIALLVVGVVAVVMGWLVAGRVLAPLNRVTDTARRIAAAPAADKGLHERIALAGPDDEVKELADTFDTMVARLDRSFDGQRRFVANASHELRTPLTLGRGLIEVAMHRVAASDDLKHLGEDLLQINARHERLISGLLLLANSENDVVDPQPVDLADVVTHVVSQTTPEAERAGVEVRTAADQAFTQGDALLLERLVFNLVENGIRHNVDDGGWVRVASREARDGDSVELEVTSTGPVVPPYDVAALFEPFRRLGSERLVTAKGAGLGLSIVRSVTRAHGGNVTAEPRDGGGLVVTVTLPMCREDEKERITELGGTGQHDC